jgi:copper resistance protein D
MVEAGLILSRFVHDAALLFVFGIALFPLYALSGEEHPAGPDVAKAKGRRGWVFATCLLALASGVAWLIFAAAAMAGSFSEAMDFDMMGTVLLGTGFGKVWSAHLALVTALAVLSGLDRLHRSVSFVLLSAACLASLAGVGHTQVEEGMHHLIHTIADGAHLLAAGAWLGGLIPLLGILIWRQQNCEEPELEIGRILMRFSGTGYLAVAVLVATGGVNSWYLVGSISALPASLYGELLLVKLGLFGLLLLLAATNRFWLLPAFEAGHGNYKSETSLARLRYHIIVEQVLGLLIVAIVSVLGLLAPPVGT